MLSHKGRLIVLFAAFSGLLFDGIELGLMPVASISVTRSLLGPGFTDALAADWFARFTAALMLGAAAGGIVFGALGDRIGRTRAMGVSILFYSIFSGFGLLVGSLEQMFVLRFLVGLGVGGMWPNGVALVSECWSNVSRPMVAGIVGAGLNTGILLLSQIARIWHITPDSWRWLFGWSAVPGLLGVVALCFVPESPRWLAARSGAVRRKTAPLRDLFRPPLLRLTVLGIVLGSIPMIGAWAASKWMIPWADKIGGAAQPGYKAVTQGYWALGAVLGSFFGAQLAGMLGTAALLFPDQPGLHGVDRRALPADSALAVGLPADGIRAGVRRHAVLRLASAVSAGAVPDDGACHGQRHFDTMSGVSPPPSESSSRARWLSGSAATSPKVGAVMSLIYSLGMVAIWWAPETSNKDLPD